MCQEGLESLNYKQITNGFILHSTTLTPSEASASETKEKQKFLELAPSELESSEGENHSLVYWRKNEKISNFLFIGRKYYFCS